MSEPKHTPCGCRIVTVVDRDGMRRVGQAEHIEYCPLHEAAPEMLKALELVEWDKYNVCPCCGRYEGDGHNAVCRIGTAIRKAKG